MQLGIQETVSDGLKKITNGLRGADDETKRLRKSLKEAFEGVQNAGSADSLLISLRKAAAELSKVENGAEALSRMLGKLDVSHIELLSSKFNEKDLSKYLDILRQVQKAITETDGYPGKIGEDMSHRIRQMQSFLGEYQSLISRQASWSKVKGFDEASEDLLKSFRARFSTLRKEFGELWKSGDWSGDKGDRLNARVSALTTDLLIYKSKAKEAADAGSSLVQGANEATEALKRTETQAAKTSAAVENLGKAGRTSGAKDVLGGQNGDFSNRMLNALRSADLEQIGIKNATVHGKEFWDVLNLINQKLKQMSTTESGAEAVKTWRTQIDNAIKYLDILQRLDIKEKEIASLRQLNPNVNSQKLVEAQRILENFKVQITGLESKIFGTGVDNSFVIGDYAKALTQSFREIKQITDAYKKENPLSVFSGGFAKVSSEISAVKAKLSTLRTLMFDGWSKGMNTQMLIGPLREMEQALTRLTTAQGNDKFLTNAEQMKNLLSDVAEATGRATAKMTEYRNAEKRAKITGELPSQEYDRQKKQQARTKQEQEEELRALDAYGQRYMALQMAKLRAEEKASAEAEKRSAQRTAKVEKDTRKMSELYAQLELAKNRAEKVGVTSLGLNVDTSKLDAKLKVVRDLSDKIFNADPRTLGLGGRKSAEDYTSQTKQAVAAVNEAIAAQKELNREREKANTGKGRDEAKAVQEAVRLAALLEELDRVSHKGQFLNIDQTKIQAARKELEDYLALMKQMSANGNYNKNGMRARELVSNKEYKEAVAGAKEYIGEQKRLQNELEIVERRLASMKNALSNAQQVRLDAHGLGADTKVIDDLIDKTKSSIYYLEELRKSLREGRGGVLGEMGQTGNGREVQSVNQGAAAQAAVNKEVKRGIELEEQRRKKVAETAAKVRSDLVSAFEKAKQAASGTSQTLQDLKSLFLQGGLVYGAQQFMMSIIQTGGELEKQHIALQSILGDMQNANTMFGQVKQLALASPFTFSELNKDVKQLAAYGVEYDELYDTTKRLADMASGLGVSFERIALAFGQVQARGWLDGKELRQIAYAGIPLLDRLSEYYSKREGQKVSTSEVKTRISARGVSFDDVKNIFWEMTDAGGQFYNMQQVLSETLLGRYNKLKDAWEIMLSGFASGNNIVGKGLMNTIDLVTELVQALNSMAPVVVAAFSGFALSKLKSTVGGGLGTAILSSKASMSSELQQKVLAGKTLEASEQRILNTKMRITAQDVRNLAAARAISKNELDRLLITNRISAEQYKQAMAMLGLQVKTISWRSALNSIKGVWDSFKAKIMQLNVQIRALRTGTTSLWAGFSAKGLAAMSVLGNGIKALGASLWAAIGGLPGLIITSVTMGLGYLYTKNEELKTAMKNTADEIEDRIKALNEFIKNSKIEEVISVGDTTEIDNLIDEYKEKLKQLAPYAYTGMVMKADEEKSHVARLRYLDEEIKRLQKAEELAKTKMGDSGNYKELQKFVKYLNGLYEDRNEFAAEKMKDGMDAGQANAAAAAAYRNVLTNNPSFIANALKRQFGDVANNEEVRMAAMQALGSIFSSLEIPEDRANEIRASVLNSLGIGDKDAWLQGEVGRKMSALINEEAAAIGYKIRSGQALTDAEKQKVKELMTDAEAGIKAQYPHLEDAVKKLLADSNFEMVIKLVLDDTGKYNDVQSEMEKRIPSIAGNKYHQYAQSWGSEGGWYAARNAAKAEIDKLYNEYKSARDSKSPNLAKAKKDYETAVDAASKLLFYNYTGEDKKSNKKKKDGRQEDTFLKEWNERLSSYKSARQSYQKYKTVMSEGEAKALIEKLYDNIQQLDLDNYDASLATLEKELEKAGLTTPDRKKALTSLKREMADWRFSEVMKPEFDRIASDFTEALEKGAKQFDLYKSLFEKTGSKNFASQAFADGALWDDAAKDMARQFKEMTGMEPDINATDATAKHYLVDVRGNQQAYDLWKKLTDRVKNNYNDALSRSADILAEAMSYEERIVALQEHYNTLIDEANEMGDTKAAIAYRQKRDKEIGAVNLEKFKNSEDYMNFYSAVTTLGMDKAQEIANRIRSELNDSLRSGAIDARQYGKEIDELRKKMDELSAVKPSFLNGGLNGLKDLLQQKGQAQYNAGQNKLSQAQEAYRVAELAQDAEGMASAEKAMKAGQSMMAGGEQLMNGASEMQGSIGMIDQIIHGINDLVQGMNDTFQDIRETAEALGTDTSSDEWEDANTFFTSFSNASNSATKGWDSLKEGNIGGVISGVVGSFTGWIKGFAQGHDKKLDNQIKIAERQEKLLQNIYDNTSSIIDKTLGGIYNYQSSDYTKNALNSVVSDYEKRKSLEAELAKVKSTGVGKSALKGAAIGGAAGSLGGVLTVAGGIAGGVVGIVSSLFSNKKKKLQSKINKLPDYGDDTYAQTQKALKTGTAYDTQLASLMAQRDQLQKKYDAESGKKNKDKDKLADYEKEIEDMRLQIQTFAQDFLKSIYSIDIKSWASELTDAVVSAWSAGEDAVDAYREKVRDMVKDVTKNIVTQKIMEKALSKPLEYLTSVLESKGQLDETDMDQLAALLYTVGDEVVPQLTGVFEALKNRGWDLSESGSSSTTNSIKGITEETADLLASYLNAVRLDVSVNRKNLQAITDWVNEMPQMGEIQRSQLAAMNQLVTLAEARNGKLDDMYSWMKRVSAGTEKVYVK